MKQVILEELLKLEQEQSIKILYAVESGSRAWGFASTNSDWDVRYIYVHPQEWYLDIDSHKDSYEKILPNDVDLAGWELRKALKLFRKANPPLLEWLQSPIVYKQELDIAQQLRQLMDIYFNPRSCMHHYLHIAEGNYRTYLQRDRVRTKKYFYVLRPILACRWIEKHGNMPPVEFHKLLEELLQDPTLASIVQELLNRKVSGEELDEEPKIEALNAYLEQEIQHIQTIIQQTEPPEKPSNDALNLLFRETIKKAFL